MLTRATKSTLQRGCKLEVPLGFGGAVLDNGFKNDFVREGQAGRYVVIDRKPGRRRNRRKDAPPCMYIVMQREDGKRVGDPDGVYVQADERSVLEHCLVLGDESE